MTTRSLPEERGSVARIGARISRQARWIRRDGLARTVEESRLDPGERISVAVRKWNWRRHHAVSPGHARAVFLAGVQRSGTNMVVRGLEKAPAVEVHNEDDRRLFQRFQLRSDAILAATIARSRHQLVLIKPLCDSHRLGDLLDAVPESAALWAYRNVDDRVRSAVAKFGDVNRRVLADIAAGDGPDRWQAGRLSPDSLELIRELDPARLSAESAAALFWLVRNRLVLEQGLARREDVLLVSYDRLVREPERVMRGVAEFVGLEFTPELCTHIDTRSVAARPPVELDPRIRAECDELAAALDAIG
ncbi:MAG TPA: sulfotransferase domain-containing protein [Mycobacteriales bacterium]|nr:sulfotransferase domain-containing protein [Mycobacteriales bacterium]